MTPSFLLLKGISIIAPRKANDPIFICYLV